MGQGDVFNLDTPLLSLAFALHIPWAVDAVDSVGTARDLLRSKFVAGCAGGPVEDSWFGEEGPKP